MYRKKLFFIFGPIVIVHFIMLSQSSIRHINKIQNFDSKGDRRTTIHDELKNELIENKRYHLPGDEAPIHTVQRVSIDSTVIDPNNLDTSGFKFNYQFWGEFDFTNLRYIGRMQFGDYNKNGKTEIFVYKTEFNQWIGPAVIYEIDSAKNIQLIYSYPESVIIPVAQYDVDGDGNKDIVLNTDGSRGIFVFSNSDTSLLPTVQKLFFSYSPDIQVDNIFLDDFDKNGKCDLLFTADIDTGGTKIYEYDCYLNNFVLIFNQPAEQAWEGYTIDDFDSDDKREIIYSTQEDGWVHAIECLREHSYAHVFKYQTELTNAHHQFKTNDIDENGKIEFWIGGNDFAIPFSYKLICFESDSDNTYSPKRSIIFLNNFGYPARKILAVDINNDGTEEIFVGLDNSLYLLSYSKASSKFEVIFFKRVPLLGVYTEVEDVNFYDLFNTGKKDMLVSILTEFGTKPGDPYEEKTEIYKLEITTGVFRSKNIVSRFELYQNYPNPYNSSTRIRFSLAEESLISISVVDILGRKVKSLINNRYQEGAFGIDWDGKDEKGTLMNSGVYFITMNANNFRKTIKTMLLK